VLLWAGLVLLGTVIAFLRIPANARNLLWAEDGRNFVADALLGHPWGALFEPFAGYMHAVPRLTSLFVVGVVPLDSVPVAITLVACAITSGIATLAFAMLRLRMAAWLPRLALWLGIVTLPIAGIEVNGSIANSHWYLLVGLFIVLVTRQRSGLAITIAAITVCLAVLSDPLAAIFLPFVLVRLLSLGRPRQLVVPVVFLASLAVQFAVVFATHITRAPSAPTPTGLLRAAAFRVFLAALAGEPGSSAAYASIGVASLVIAVIIVVTCLCWSVLRDNNLGGLATAAIASAVVFYVISIWIRWFPESDPAVSTAWWSGSRYSVVPICLILMGLAAASATVKGHPRGRVVPFLGGAALLCLVAVIALPAFSVTARQPQQGWVAGLAQARERCLSLPSSHSVVIGTAPVKWSIELDCRTILNHN
jgi:hypothetical protein